VPRINSAFSCDLCSTPKAGSFGGFGNRKFLIRFAVLHDEVVFALWIDEVPFYVFHGHVDMLLHIRGVGNMDILSSTFRNSGCEA
jgi:hypothetical protein